MKSDVVIVDYGVGNVGSILNMIRKTGKTATLSADPTVLTSANRLILPGVGSFDSAVERLAAEGLDQVVIDAAHQGIPLLGVCLGMQLLLESSEEGKLPGLGLIKGSTHKFDGSAASEKLRIPHMGWNEVEPVKTSCYIPSLGDEDRYYFVHSYYVQPSNPEDVLATTSYGQVFASAVESENVVGVQFHPEKSHRFGARLLSEFVGGHV